MKREGQARVIPTIGNLFPSSLFHELRIFKTIPHATGVSPRWMKLEEAKLDGLAKSQMLLYDPQESGWCFACAAEKLSSPIS